MAVASKEKDEEVDEMKDRVLNEVSYFAGWSSISHGDIIILHDPERDRYEFNIKSRMAENDDLTKRLAKLKHKEHYEIVRWIEFMQTAYMRRR